MDIAAIVNGFPDVEPMPGLARAWRWSVAAGMFNFALALSHDGGSAFEISCRDHYDPELVRATLGFARDHQEQMVRGGPIARIDGFTPPNGGFDVVVAVSPSIHNAHEDDPQLHSVTFDVFPAYRCEFTGHESEPEAVLRYGRMVDTADLTREPNPLLRMRYENSETGGGSVGDDRGIADASVLYREIANLQGAPGSFVEFENFEGRVYHIEWDAKGWSVRERDGTLRRMELQGLLDRVKRILIEGQVPDADRE